MGTLLLEQIKKQAAIFIEEKYKIARMAFTDVTEAEMLAEKATNKDPCSPDAKTMTRIAEKSFQIDDYWRIVDVLRSRLYRIDWSQWRQSYKALVLLEFLLTRGPEEFAQEFLCDADIIGELGNFTHTDERGFDWGARMQERSDQILTLLQGGETLREARLKALKITNEIQGFGSNSLNSPSSPSSPSSSESSARNSSFGSFSTTSSPTYFDSNELKNQSPTKEVTKSNAQGGIGDDNNNNNNIGLFPSNNFGHGGIDHLWDGPAGEDDLIDYDDEDEIEEKPKGFVSGIYSKLIGSGEKIEFRCLSDAGRKGAKKKFDRQYSLGY